MPVRKGDGTVVSPGGIAEVRKGDGTVLQPGIITDGLVTRFTFEDDSDETVAVDSHGPNDGEIAGGSFDQDSAEGDTALLLDGSAGDYMEYPDTGATGISSQAAWSVSFFVKFNGSIGDKIQNMWHPRDEVDINFRSQSGDGHIQLGNSIGSGSLNTDFIPNVGQYYQMGLAYDPSTDIIFLYIDGNQEESGELGNSTNPDFTNQIGAQLLDDGTERWNLDGLIDDFRIYDRQLDGVEMSSIANGNG